MFLKYSALINSMDSGAVVKLTINNHRLNRADFESIPSPCRCGRMGGSVPAGIQSGDYGQGCGRQRPGAGEIRDHYHLLKRDVEAARTYLARAGAGPSSHFGELGPNACPLMQRQSLRIFHGFYRPGEESAYCFDIREAMAKGHDFRDYICPDSMERHKDYLQIGSRYCRILYLKDYASLPERQHGDPATDVSRSLMLSIDFIPVPMDEAIKEAERRVLGGRPTCTTGSGGKNSQGNFGSEPPYDMKLQRQRPTTFG